MPNDNFPLLASSYLTYLTGMGALAITVLTLVLALPRSEDKTPKSIYELLVAALIVAAIVCFIGAHLMSQTAAISPRQTRPQAMHERQYVQSRTSERKVGPVREETSERTIRQRKLDEPGDASKPPDGAMRLFMVAAPTVYLASTIFLLALLLLPTNYERNGYADLATKIAYTSFLFIQVASYLWVNHFVFALRNPHTLMVIALATISALTLFLICWRVPSVQIYRWHLSLRAMPFVLCLFVALISLEMYAWTTSQRTSCTTMDIAFYVFGSLSPPAALFGIATREAFPWNSDTGENEAQYAEQPMAASSNFAGLEARVEGDCITADTKVEGEAYDAKPTNEVNF